MKPSLLDRLVCPACRSSLSLTSATRDGEAIIEGRLVCGGCGTAYPITRGIPRLLPAGLTTEANATAERFSYEWTRFSEIRTEYESQFRGWIAPIGPEAFAGATVLDAGCGKGRHLRLAATFGAREVVGIDLGSAVDIAAKNTADLPNVHVIQGDVTRPPLRPASFDVVYSIGVLHHLGRPESGFQALTPLLRSGGLLVTWLYAREGNGWVLALVDPIRRITRRLPLPLVSAFAWGLTVPLWLTVRGFYAPARRFPRLLQLLPYQSYLSDLVPFPFRELHSIAFDQLLAPVAHYLSRTEVERCFATSGLRVGSLRWHHANSWAGWGTAG